MRITLVRHGETTGQSSIRYYGATDVPLSDLGRQQMQRASAALAGERFNGVYSSALSRSHEGARIVSGVEPVVVPDFNEVSFGNWEGWTREEIAERDPENYRIWQANKGRFQYPGGEARADFHARVTAGLAQVLSIGDFDHLLLVLHRGVIAVVLAELLHLDDERRLALEIDLGSIHRTVRKDDVWTPEVLNSIPSHAPVRVG